MKSTAIRSRASQCYAAEMIPTRTLLRVVFFASTAALAVSSGACGGGGGASSLGLGGAGSQASSSSESASQSSASHTSSSTQSSSSTGGGGGTGGSGGSGGKGGGSGGTGGTGGTGGSGGAGAQGGGGAGGGVVQSGVGKTCTADADCGNNLLKCSTAKGMDQVFGGGPANGYCTKACTLDSDCPSDALCYPPGGPGECVEQCSWGVPALMFINDPLDKTKCYGREDARCIDLGMGAGACLPTCGADADCPVGEHCDPRTAVCVAVPTAGDPMGAKCDPAMVPSNCAGLCLSAGMTQTECSQVCVVGGDLNGNDCGGLAKGLCAYIANGTGAGDEAYCTPACSKQADCQTPGWSCFALKGVTGVTVQNGWCFGSIPCPNGQPDCAAMPFGNPLTCTMTPNGPICVDTSIP